MRETEKIDKADEDEDDDDNDDDDDDRDDNGDDDDNDDDDEDIKISSKKKARTFFGSVSTSNLGEKKNGGFLELILQGLTYPIWIFSVSLMKVYQICYLTVKDSFKSMNAVRNNSPIINTGVIDESPSFFLLCIFQKIIIIFERLSLINGTKLKHADFTIT